LTLSETVETYSADGMRIALADAGDAVEDANFVRDVADNGLLRLYNMIEYTKEVISDRKSGKYRTGEKTSLDLYFVNRLNELGAKAYEAYSKTEYKVALKFTLYEYQSARDTYRELCGGEHQMHAELVDFHTDTQYRILSPICPHVCEHVWSLLGKTTLVVDEKWPVFGEVDHNLLKELDFILGVLHEFRQKYLAYVKPKKGAPPNPPTRGIIYVADIYPPWQAEVLQLVRNLRLSSSSFPDMRDISSKLDSSEVLKKNKKKVMPFVSIIKGEYDLNGETALRDDCAIDQWAILERFSGYTRQTLNLTNLEMVGIKDATGLADHIVDKCGPLKPLILFEA